MNIIKVLDCTLRDGGYCNNWNFGKENIKQIINGLQAANVDIVECGFLTNKVEFKSNNTKYTSLNQLDEFIPKHNMDKEFVVMMNYGEYDVNDIPEKKDTRIDGIRLAFHKNNRYDAIMLCNALKDKGYKVYVQPMVSMSYTEEEFIEIIELVNRINPHAFYIVDSFGTMQEENLDFYYDICTKHLNEDVYIGFHSHNNLQSAFSNAKSLIKKDRRIIIDASVYGMGRGAGNLNVELFLNELNKSFFNRYDIKPIIHIMDNIINGFYEMNPWGYSLPNYLSAVHMVHPNYAKYLTEKKSIQLDDMDEILSMLQEDKAYEYDEKYIEKLYIKYMSAGIERNDHLKDIVKKTKGKKILLIAPGRTAFAEKEKIIDFVKSYEPIVISINHNYTYVKSDYIFVSNMRRFSKLSEKEYRKTITTSNIKNLETYASIDYYSLLNMVGEVKDNAGLMALNFIKKELEVEEVFIAGMDGYSADVKGNYENEDLLFIMSEELMKKKNAGMIRVLEKYSKDIKITFITSTLLRK